MPLGAAKFNVSDVIADAATELRIPDFGWLGRPFFLSAAQRGLTEMNSDTNFFKKVWDKPIDSLVINLPNDLTEKDGVWLVKGSGSTITSSTILFIKPNMYHKGGEGYIANNKGRNHDMLQWSLSWSETPPKRLYFAGEFNGALYLSPSCQQWDYLHVRYTGLGMDCFGEEFEVPHWCREAITDYVIHRCAMALERDDPQQLGRVIRRKHEELKAVNGSWMTAIGRLKRLDKKGRYDTSSYTTRFGHFP